MSRTALHYAVSRTAWNRCATWRSDSARNLLELTNSDQLQDEGDPLEHDVSTWTAYCMFDRTHVFSVRDRAGRRHSTLAPRLDADAEERLRPAITDHRAFRNCTPWPECRAAAQALVQATEAVDLRALEDALQEHLGRQTELTCSLDLAQETDALRRALPEALKRVLWPVRDMPDSDGE